MKTKQTALNERETPATEAWLDERIGERRRRRKAAPAQAQPRVTQSDIDRSLAEKQAQHSPLPKLQADECPDANGFVTLRPFDGSPNGDTIEQPIATVYDSGHASFIVRACNEYGKHADWQKVAIRLKAALDLTNSQRDEAKHNAQRLADALEKAIAKETKERGALVVNGRYSDWRDEASEALAQWKGGDK